MSKDYWKFKRKMHLNICKFKDMHPKEILKEIRIMTFIEKSKE